jgi:hypothetical protein
MPYKTTPLPIQAGCYWFRVEASPWSIEGLVSVRFKQEELTARWHHRDIPIANLKGSWRGPIIPFGNRVETDLSPPKYHLSGLLSLPLVFS